MRERVRLERVGEGLAHLALRLVDQDRADPDPLVGDHPAGAALQMRPAVGGRVAGAQPLPALVGAAALGLGAHPEDRQDLESRLVDAELGQELEEAYATGARGVLVVHLGHRDHRVDARGVEVADPPEDAIEGAGAADRIVRGGIVTVHRDPEVERIVAARGERGQTLAAHRVEQQAVGEHGRRTVVERACEDRLHLRVQERLAAGEVVLPNPEPGRLLEVGLDLGEGHRLVRVVGRRAGDETVGAGEVADRAGDLEPEGVERPQLDHRHAVDALGATRHFRHRPGSRLSSNPPARSMPAPRW